MKFSRGTAAQNVLAASSGMEWLMADARKFKRDEAEMNGRAGVVCEPVAGQQSSAPA